MSNHITKKDAENLFKDYNTLKDTEITNKLNSIKSSQVTSMHDYSEALVPFRILTTDTLNAAMGKLEYKANRGWQAEQELASLCKNCIRVPDYDNTKIEYTYGVPRIDVEPYGINGFTNKEVITGEFYDNSSFYIGFITAADSPVILKIGLPHDIGKNTFTFENLTSVDDVPSPVGLCLAISSTNGHIWLRIPLSNIARVKHGIYTLSYEITSFDPYTVGGVIIDKIQLEEGSVATDFELNIEDAFVQLPEVASTALSEANRANNKIDNLQVGGVNRFKQVTANKNSTNVAGNKSIILNLVNDADTTFNIQLYEDVSIGDTYTISCDVSGFASDSDTSAFAIETYSSTPFFEIKNGRCNLIYTFKQAHTANSNILFDDRQRVTGNNITLSNFKIEKGNMATDYSPAPEDVDADISTAQTTANTANTTANTANALANELDSLQMPTGEILWLSAKGSTTASIAQDNGVIDVSGNGNHGRAYNGVTIVNDSEMGACYSFDGTDDEISTNGINIGANSFTLVASIYLDSNYSGGWNLACVASSKVHSDTSAKGFALTYNRADKKFLFATADGTNYQQYYTNSIDIRDKWVDVAMVRDSSNIGNSGIYLNGVKLALEHSIEQNNNVGNGTIQIGFLRGVHRFLGKISDIRIYPYALTASQVKALYKYGQQGQDNTPTLLIRSLDTRVAALEGVKQINRYGFRIDQTNSDPDACVTYLYDAVGMTPADLTADDTFSYGDWQNFVNDVCKPVMVAPDGTVLYDLDRTDQTKRIDGGTSDIADINQTANAMVQFKKKYMSLTHPNGNTDIIDCVFCDIPLDETYQALAFTNEQGEIKDSAFYSMFEGVLDSNNKVRSIGNGGTPYNNVSGETMRTYCQANGDGWDFPYLSLHNYIALLHVLISKSRNTQYHFGQGNSNSAQNAPSLTGALKAVGGFTGKKTAETSPIKSFWIENFWGNYWKWVNGLLGYNNDYYVKNTPPYTNSDLTGYAKATTRPDSNWQTKQIVSNGVVLPYNTSSSGSSSTYVCDYTYNTKDAVVRSCVCGGARYTGGLCGAFSSNLTALLSYNDWPIGCRLSLLK